MEECTFPRMKENNYIASIENRIIKQGFVSSIFGQVYYFGDIGQNELEVLSSSVDDYGALLVVPNSALTTSPATAKKLNFGTSNARKRQPTDSQLKAVKDLANAENTNSLKTPVRRLVEIDLPALSVASLLITTGAFEKSLYTPKYSDLRIEMVPSVIVLDPTSFAIKAAKNAVTKLRQ